MQCLLILLLDHLLNKHREGIEKFRKTEDLKNLYRNQLEKAFLTHDAAYSNSKDLAKRTISDNILKDRAYEINRSCNYIGYQRVITSMVYKFFVKKTRSRVSVNEQLAKELHKPGLENSKEDTYMRDLKII